MLLLRNRSITSKLVVSTSKCRSVVRVHHVRSLMAAPSEQQHTFEVTMENFKSTVMKEKKCVILDAYATWCKPCGQIAPALEQVVKLSEGQITLGKLNVDEQPELAASLQVKSLPTVYGVYDGRIVDSFVGIPSQTNFNDFIMRLKKAAKLTSPSQDSKEVIKSAEEALQDGKHSLAANLYQHVLVLEEAASRSRKKNMTTHEIQPSAGLTGDTNADVTGKFSRNAVIQC
jgi:thioredoxin